MKSLIPAITVRRGGSVINRPALEILTQNGAQYVAVIVRAGKAILKPLEIEGLLKVTSITNLDCNDTRAHACLGIAEALGLPAATRFAAHWNDADEQLELDLDAPLAARARTTNAA
jgi:hypothetical protein